MIFNHNPGIIVTPIESDEVKKHELRVFLDVYQIEDIQRDIRSALNSLVGMKKNEDAINHAHNMIHHVLDKYVEAGVLKHAPMFSVSIDEHDLGRIRILMEDIENCV